DQTKHSNGFKSGQEEKGTNTKNSLAILHLLSFVGRSRVLFQYPRPAPDNRFDPRTCDVLQDLQVDGHIHSKICMGL
ncbi:Uncharacterized protein FKW44_015431, partial [Caligus rogercresseyi]